MTIRPLSVALKKKAKKEINEDDRRVAADITALKEWLRKQPHLETVQPTDQWLLAFLRGSKFSLERTKQKFDMYYTLKTVVPEFLSNRDPLDQKIQGMLKSGFFLPLKSCQGEDSPRTCIVRVGAFDPSQYHLTDVIKIAFMITELMMLEDDNFTVAGEEVIVDMRGVGVNVLSQWTPALAKKVISCFERALPVRVRATYIINTPTGFEAAYSIFKAFLGEKLKKRIKVYNKDYKALYKAVPQSMLPAEYGGQDGSLEELIEYWKAKVEGSREWFLSQEGARSEEAQRAGAPQTSSLLFGVEGSFRKLQVD